MRKSGYSKQKVFDLRKHLKKRLYNRFGLKLNRFQYRAFLEEFNESSILIQKETNLKSWYYLNYERRHIFLLFDAQRKEPITAYTLKMFLETCETKDYIFDPDLFFPSIGYSVPQY